MGMCDCIQHVRSHRADARASKRKLKRSRCSNRKRSDSDLTWRRAAPRRAGSGPPDTQQRLCRRSGNSCHGRLLKAETRLNLRCLLPENRAQREQRIQQIGNVACFDGGHHRQRFVEAVTATVLGRCLSASIAACDGFRATARGFLMPAARCLLRRAVD